MKILIADDDLTSRTILQGVLIKWGYEVIAVSDGEEAYAVFEQDDPPQLAVLDWMMPGMDGPTLCRKLRGLKGKSPLYLILLTAKGECNNIVEGLEAGAVDYIAKPYDAAELHARVDVGTRVIRLQNEMRERERLQGVLELAGAICHELNQPLQSVLGFSELLLMDLETTDPNYEMVKSIKAGATRIGQLARKIMKITRYQSKPYLKSKIIDIEQASRLEDESHG